MRSILVAGLLVIGTNSLAAPPRKFTLAYDEGGISPKGAVKSKSVFTVDGTKLRYEMTYAGPAADKPENKPRKLDVVIKNEAALDKALAALEAVAVTPDKPIDQKKATWSVACITIGAKKRCESSKTETKDGDGRESTPGYSNMEKLAEVLLDNVPPVNK